jgi:hypothetical protein
MHGFSSKPTNKERKRQRIETNDSNNDGAAGLILVVAADAQSVGDRTTAAKLLPGAEEDLQYAWDHLTPSERANLKKDQLAWIKAKDSCTDPVQKFHMIQDRTKVICQHLSKEPVTVAKDGHGKEITVQNTDGSNKSKGYLYTDDQGKLLVGQKDEDSVNYEVGVALVAGAHPTRMQIMEYTSKLGAEKYPSGSDKTHDFSAINLRMSGWFSSQLYIRICGKLGIDPDFHGKSE